MGVARTLAPRPAIDCRALELLVLRNRIMIYGPESNGTYIVEFKTADGEALAINVPAGKTRVLKHFQKRMPYGRVVPDAP